MLLRLPRILLIMLTATGFHPAFGQITFDSTDHLSAQDSLQLLEDWPVREIPGNFFGPWLFYGKQEIVFSDNGDSVAILQKLFPGKLVEPTEYDSPDAPPQAGWSCSACPKIQLDNGLLDEDGDRRLDFPFTGFNFTCIISDRLVPPDKRVICFSTSESSDVGGRFVGGVLGMAVLQMKTGRWHLLQFTPGLDYQGMYSRANAPDTVLAFGPKLLLPLELHSPCGPPLDGWYPCWTAFKLYGEQVGSMAKMLDIQDYTCVTSNSDVGFPEWTSVRYFESCPKGFCPLTILTAGRIEKNAEFNEAIKYIVLPKQLKDIVARQDSFDFTLERKFIFQAGHYELAKEHLEIDPFTTENGRAELAESSALDFAMTVDSSWTQRWYALIKPINPVTLNICIGKDGHILLARPSYSPKSMKEYMVGEVARHTVQDEMHFAPSERDFRFRKVFVRIE